MTSRLWLTEIAAADIRLRPAEAVTIAAEICRQYAQGEIRGIPSPSIIHITREGQVVAQGPMTRAEAVVARAGHLLEELLPGVDAPAEYRASGGLRLVIARALGTLDLPPYSGLDELRAALARFADPDPAATIRGLFRRWEPVTALAPSGPRWMARIEPPVAPSHRSGRFSSALMVVVAALFALGTFAIVMGSANSGNAQPPVPSPRTSPVTEARPVASSGVMAATAPPAASKAPARPRARRASAPTRARAATRPRSFFNRELIRIEIK